MSGAVVAAPITPWKLLPAEGHTKRDFLSVQELTVEEMAGLLDLAETVKQQPALYRRALDGRNIALVFEKPSLRTRVTFEVGARQLGADATYLAPSDIALGRRESAADVARNLARWVDAIVVRTFSQKLLDEMAAVTHIPIINALSDLRHPCQAVADFLTLRELKGRLAGLRLAWVGDGNNVAHSLMFAAARTGVHLTLAVPRGYAPDPVLYRQARKEAAETGASIELIYEPHLAVRDADAVYTDVWTSMGQEAEAERRRLLFAPYRVDRELMRCAKPDAVFMHCLPAHRGEEVTAEVLDGPASVVLEQAENRLHVAKAVLLALLREAS
jgi:ornithine carbamoyltransferase